MRAVAAVLAVSLTLSALAAPAAAQTPLTAEEFEAYVTGRTLTYAIDGQAYGIEQYLPGRRVLWAFVGDVCQEGVWYERDGLICFLYDYNPTDEQCWLFWMSGSSLTARFMGEGSSTELVEVEQTDRGLSCAPAVGV